MSCKEIIERLHDDEVVEITSMNERNELFDYMIENDIDPNDYRTVGKAIWLA